MKKDFKAPTVPLKYDKPFKGYGVKTDFSHHFRIWQLKLAAKNYTEGKMYCKRP